MVWKKWEETWNLNKMKPNFLKVSNRQLLSIPESTKSSCSSFLSISNNLSFICEKAIGKRERTNILPPNRDGPNASAKCKRNRSSMPLYNAWPHTHTQNAYIHTVICIYTYVRDSKYIYIYRNHVPISTYYEHFHSIYGYVIIVCVFIFICKCLLLFHYQTMG